MNGQPKVKGRRTPENIADKGKEMLEIGMKVVVKKRTERRTGEVVACSNHTFLVDFGRYTESFRYAQLFCQEEERVYVK